MKPLFAVERMRYMKLPFDYFDISCGEAVELNPRMKVWKEIQMTRAGHKR